MPIIKSQKKRVKTNEKRRQRNAATSTRMKTFLKKADQAIAGGKADEIDTAVKEAVAQIDAAARSGVLHANSAARKKSSLQRRANAAQGS